MGWTGLDPELPGAACRDHPSLPPDAWFADPGRLREAAIRACLSCPELAACREWSIATPALLGGVFAGLSDAERQRERERREHIARMTALSLRTRRARMQRKIEANAKRCPRCGETKPLSAFYAVPSARGDGLSPYCKPCNSAAGKARRAAARQKATAA